MTLTEANTHKNSRSYAAWFLINLPSFWGCEDETYTTTTFKVCPFYCVSKHTSHEKVSQTNTLFDRCSNHLNSMNNIHMVEWLSHIPASVDKVKTSVMSPLKAEIYFPTLVG